MLTVADLLDLTNRIGAEKQDFPAQEALVDQLQENDRNLRPRIVPGRILRFSVADGEALYLLTHVGRKVCRLLHIPFLDEYRSPAVSPSGKMLTETVKHHIEGSDMMDEMLEGL